MKHPVSLLWAATFRASLFKLKKSLRLIVHENYSDLWFRFRKEEKNKTLWRRHGKKNSRDWRWQSEKAYGVRRQSFLCHLLCMLWTAKRLGRFGRDSTQTKQLADNFFRLLREFYSFMLNEWKALGIIFCVQHQQHWPKVSHEKAETQKTTDHWVRDILVDDLPPSKI